MPDHKTTFNAANLVEQLKRGLQKLDWQCSDHQLTQLIDYLALLHHWNRAYNLTAVKEPQDMLVHHLLDCLAVAPYLQGKNFVDVGTGAGLPGIPLAIVNRHRKFVLLDSNGKKTRFLFQAKMQLNLENVEEIQLRVENYRVDNCYHGILSRGFTSLTRMVQNTAHLLAPEGRFYAMKGKFPESELSQLPKNYNVEATIKLAVPQLNKDRYLIVINNKKIVN